jgi:hypothetical protein
MTSQNVTGFKTFQATAAAIAAFVRVTYDSNGLISVAGATDNWIGVTQEYIPASGYGTVKLRGAPGTQYVMAGAVVARGAKLNPLAAGKVDDAAGTGPGCGLIALEAATGDGDVIEATACDTVAFTAGATMAALAAYGTGAFGLDSDAHMKALFDKVEAIAAALVTAGLIKQGA